MMSVLSLYESSFNVSSSAMASSNAYNSSYSCTLKNAGMTDWQFLSTNAYAENWPKACAG